LNDDNCANEVYIAKSVGKIFDVLVMNQM
jgi:hypothetical protein